MSKKPSAPSDSPVMIQMPSGIPRWNVERLKPYAQNARTHSESQVAKIAASMIEFGFTNPVLIDSDAGIIAGHGRLLAAKLLGLTEVPVVELTHLTPAQRRAYVIADNRLALDAGWDDEILAAELKALDAMDYDLSFTGFGTDELFDLMADENGEDEAAPAPPDAPCTEPGDLWVLGDHRLMCGDSGKTGDVDRLVAGALMHLCNTDPPYNTSTEPRSNNARAAGGSTALPVPDGKSAPATTSKMRPKDRVIKNDNMESDDFARILISWFRNIARVLTPGRAYYIWGGYSNWSDYCQAMAISELRFAQGVVWVKHHPVLGRKDMMNDCEFAWYGWREGAGHLWFGPPNVSNVWEVKKVAQTEMIHLTEKPIQLAINAIHYSSRVGENVLDLFGGSGSTLIACEKTGRKAYLCEIDPAYCDVIVMRWQNETGRVATLEGTDRTFAVVAEERGRAVAGR